MWTHADVFDDFEDEPVLGRQLRVEQRRPRQQRQFVVGLALIADAADADAAVVGVILADVLAFALGRTAAPASALVPRQRHRPTPGGPHALAVGPLYPCRTVLERRPGTRT